ncbi:MAG TPA: glycosyltransferase [Bacteroidia bacterium]
MKVLRVIASMNPEHGGPCQGIRNSIPEFTKFGIVNEVVCMDAPDAEFIGKDPFKIHAIGKGKTSWQYNPELLKWLKIHLQDYDRVIVHGLWQYHGYAVFKAMRSLTSGKKPLCYVMPHGMLDPYFQKAPDRKIKAIRNSIFWKLIEKNVINSADAVLFTCEEELLLAAGTFPGYHPKKVLNVGYGIQTPPSSDATYNPQGNLLFLSRIHPKKGVELLIKAYETVYGEVNDAPKLVIAGPGIETEYGIELKKMVQSSEFLKHQVAFPGMLKGDDKWQAFKNAQAFVLPSHQENFGIAVAESLAEACPVLITDKVNIWREIQADNAGLCDKDTLEGCTSLLRKWKALDEVTKTNMSKSAHQCFSQRFTISKAFEQMAQQMNLNLKHAQ